MINVNFTGYTTYTVDKVTQWDVNRKLRITGLSLPVAPVIYFGNKKSITATGVNATRSGGVITCPVPNALLTESYTIYAYVQITDNGETKTVETIKIPVTAAKEPDNYVFYDNIPVVTYNSLETEISRLRAAVGSPLVASTVAEMTDRTKVYVYMGNETGYTSGNWYYYDGSEWTSGGVYNSTAFETDKTLSVLDSAADAKVVGDAINLINAGLMRGRGTDFTPYPLGVYVPENETFDVWDDMPLNSVIECLPAKFKNSISETIKWSDTSYYQLLKIANRIYLTCPQTGQVYIGTSDLTSDVQSWINLNEYSAGRLHDEINELRKIINGETYLPFSASDGFAILISNGTEITNATFSATNYVKIPENSRKLYYMRVKLTQSSTLTGIGFYDADKVYISGVPNDVNAESYSAELYAADVPTNAVYVRFSYYLTTNKIQPPFYCYVIDDDNLMYRVDRLETAVIDFGAKLPVEFMDGGGIAYRDFSGDPAGGEVFPSTTLSYSDYLKLPQIATKIKYMRMVVTRPTATGGMAFYDAEKRFISGIQNRTGASAYGAELYETDIPENAVYARFTYYLYAYTMYPPFAVYADASKIDEMAGKGIDAVNVLGLHTVPDNEGMLNVIKRCREFTDIEWTPVVDLPRLCTVTRSTPGVTGVPVAGLDLDFYEGVFKAGVKYKGIPYGRCVSYKSGYGYSNTYLGLTIPFDAFISSISNPDSMVSVDSQYSESDHRSIPYAIVCSALTCYALNTDRYYETWEIGNIPGLQLIGLISDINPNIIKLGDVLNRYNYHSAVITDIVRDNGEVTFIEISDASTTGNGNESINGGQFGGICRRVFYTRDDFVTRWGDYSLYRYDNIASIPYSYNKYVDVGDGINLTHFNNYPCMPYEGVGFKYKASKTDSIKILISCHNYEYLRLYRDDIAIADYEVASDTEFINVTTVTVGEYKAVLIRKDSENNITARTAPCYWSVI